MPEYKPTIRVLQAVVANERIMLDLLQDLGVKGRGFSIGRVRKELTRLESESDPLTLRNPTPAEAFEEFVDEVNRALNPAFLKERRALMQGLDEPVVTKLTVLAENQKRLIENLETESDLLTHLMYRNDVNLRRWLDGMSSPKNGGNGGGALPPSGIDDTSDGTASNVTH